MTSGEAIKHQRTSIDAWRWPVARLSNVREYQSMLEDDRWRGYQTSENINKWLNMTGGEAIKYRYLKMTGGPPLSVDYMYVWWWGYQMSENIDQCLKMTGDEAIKNRCLKMTTGEAIKSWRISKCKDYWGPSLFCPLRLVARLSKGLENLDTGTPSLSVSCLVAMLSNVG